LSSGGIFQQFGHAFGIGTCTHIDGDFNPDFRAERKETMSEKKVRKFYTEEFKQAASNVMRLTAIVARGSGQGVYGRCRWTLTETNPPFLGAVQHGGSGSSRSTRTWLR
jgi:hypothetical protein